MDTTPYLRMAIVTAMVLSMLIIAGSKARGNEPAAGAGGVEDVVTVEGGSPEQLETLEFVLGRYRTAGLTVPGMTIRFQSDQRVCGQLGGFIGVIDGRVVIETCLDPGNGLGHNLFHEIAHAWEFEELDETERRRFLALRDLDRWHDPERDDWPYRGAEQAAEIVAWGLQTEYRPIPTRVGSVGAQDAASLWIAFETLTGHAPLWGVSVG